ncbi:hypothetical protein U9M48_044660 [Paspalum notatum var. saurae]|uniref:Uncharacterized protein n=1 Tax=Paspalum notatum var. saurae TaxID=547442 RepID=A0AAQ3V1M2_PASNO
MRNKDEDAANDGFISTNPRLWAVIGHLWGPGLDKTPPIFHCLRFVHISPPSISTLLDAAAAPRTSAARRRRASIGAERRRRRRRPCSPPPLAAAETGAGEIQQFFNIPPTPIQHFTNLDSIFHGGNDRHIAFWDRKKLRRNHLVARVKAISMHTTMITPVMPSTPLTSAKYVGFVSPKYVCSGAYFASDDFMSRGKSHTSLMANLVEVYVVIEWQRPCSFRIPQPGDGVAAYRQENNCNTVAHHIEDIPIAVLNELPNEQSSHYPNPQCKHPETFPVVLQIINHTHQFKGQKSNNSPTADGPHKIIIASGAKPFGIKLLHDQGSILFSLLLKSRQFISRST